MFIKHTFIAITILGTMILGCSEKVSSKKPAKPKGVLFKDAINNDSIYLGKKVTKKEFNALKKQEAKFVLKHAKAAYGLNFKIKQSKYINFLYTCTEKQAKRFYGSTLKFLRAVYPEYFQYEPDKPINVFYFRNLPQYGKRTGSGAFGYYHKESGLHKVVTFPGALEGTLWHELFHAFQALNVPHDPQQWFSEGLASFYDSGFMKNGKFVEGYTNWRMPDLHQEIKSKQLGPLGQELRDNYMTYFSYAAAKFFFIYLYGHGVQREFVNRYYFEILPKYEKQPGDHTVALLEELLGMKIAEINKDFRATALKYGPGKRIKKGSLKKKKKAKG